MAISFGEVNKGPKKALQLGNERGKAAWHAAYAQCSSKIVEKSLPRTA